MAKQPRNDLEKHASQVNEGYAARLSGESIEANPHHGAEAVAWERGYRAIDINMKTDKNGPSK